MFAVAVWELLTESRRTPYEEAKNIAQVICGVCTGQLRLDIAEVSFHPHLTHMLEACMDLRPDKRPSMQRLVKGFEAIYAAIRQSTLMRKKQLGPRHRKGSHSFGGLFV